MRQYLQNIYLQICNIQRQLKDMMSMYARTTKTVYGVHACKYDTIKILQLYAIDQFNKKNQKHNPV